MKRSTAIVAIVSTALTILFAAINPLAGLGFAVLALLALFPVVVYRWACELLREGRGVTFHPEAPGRPLRFSGTISDRRLDEIRARFAASAGPGHVMLYSEGAAFTPTSSFHPPLPEGFRHPAWELALATYRAQVVHGVTAYREPEPVTPPPDYVPVLDRDFAVVTDCRFRHMAAHPISEVRDGFIVRECTTCIPSTFWIERA